MDLVPLAPRARLLFHLQALVGLLLFWGPVTAVATVLLLFVLPAAWVAALILAWLLVLFLYVVWYPTFVFERWGWRLRDDELLIAHGVLFRQVTAIPTNRIQHVDTRQGPLEQWLGLSRVQVYTASNLGADGVIPGLIRGDAEALRDDLVRLGGGDDGV